VSAKHLSEQERRALLAFVAKARALCGSTLREIRLYGSRARGEGHEHSDLDLFVLVEERSQAVERALDDVAADLCVDTGLLLSPRLWGRVEWNAWLAEGRPLALAIQGQGILL